MKKIFGGILLLFLSLTVFAQEAKPDIITKTNGEEMKGKVLEITDTEVKFSYTGETTVYTLKKSEIAKITHSSGRVETFSSTTAPTETKTEAAPAGQKTTSADSRNKVAVLPFAFIKDGQSATDVLSEKVQAETYSYLSKHSGIYTLLDPRTTNALLIKAGVSKDNIKGYTMDEICKILGVEYVIEGIVSVNLVNQSNYQSNNGAAKTQNNTKSSDRKTTYSGSSYSTSSQNYSTTLNLNIYNDKGASVYSQERKSLFNTSQDAYIATLEYLLKRTPLYTK